MLTDKPKLMHLNWCNSQSVVMSFTAENTFTWYTVNTWMDSLPYPGRLDHVFVVVLLLLSFVQFSTLHRKTSLKTFFPPLLVVFIFKPRRSSLAKFFSERLPSLPHHPPPPAKIKSYGLNINKYTRRKYTYLLGFKKIFIYLFDSTRS